ncbi:MAG: histidine phosphatase family protein [Pseudomonadota bacterium]
MILVRHGQSHFNVHFHVTREDPGLVDPGLTEDGVLQAKAAAETLRDEDIGRILASPYTRTLETASIIAESLALPIKIEAVVRERAYFTCDIGTPRSELAERWPNLAFDHLEEQWWPNLDETEAQVDERCRRFRNHMAGQDDWSRVLVVTHWGFIRGLTGREVHNGAILRFHPHEGHSQELER